MPMWPAQAAREIGTHSLRASGGAQTCSSTKYEASCRRIEFWCMFFPGFAENTAGNLRTLNSRQFIAEAGTAITHFGLGQAIITWKCFERHRGYGWAETAHPCFRDQAGLDHLRLEAHHARCGDRHTIRSPIPAARMPSGPRDQGAALGRGNQWPAR